MAKSDVIEVDGKVIEALPNAPLLKWSFQTDMWCFVT